MAPLFFNLRSPALISSAPMPELPEVEYERRTLDRWLRGATILSAQAHDRVIMRPRAPATLARDLKGRRVERVDRRGKWMRLALSGGAFLFSHLGMTGGWERGDPGDPHQRWERARLVVERRGKRARVSYVDARRFGRLVFSKDDIPTWSALGPDPLEHGIDTKRLAEVLLRRRRRSIKEALMDQTVLAGVGNIQATEALWKARVDPRSPAGALGPREIAAVVRGLRWTIERTLADIEARDGEYGDPFLVYGHKGEPCPRCRTALVRIVLGGRSTTFCPGCQRRLRARA